MMELRKGIKLPSSMAGNKETVRDITAHLQNAFVAKTIFFALRTPLKSYVFSLPTEKFRITSCYFVVAMVA